MVQPTSGRSPRQGRRRFSRVSRNAVIGRRAFERGLARFGFHAVVMTVGLSVAVSAWSGPRDSLRLHQAADFVLDRMSDDVELPVLEQVASAPAGEPMKPLLRRVTEGDTIRAIAAEYSVSISTILASNKIDDPDLIMPGQELLIPPVEGVVAEVEPGETLAQLAERFGVDALDIAEANALSNDPEQLIPYERLIVPGLEPAERAATPGGRRTSVQAGVRANVEPLNLSKLSMLEYEVQEGDTLGQLSAQFGVNIWTILTANNIGNPDLLKPGMRLKVLPVNGVTHEVQAGESLFDIANYYEVDLGPLVDFNTIGDSDNLKVGDRLTIPGAEKAQPNGSLASIARAASQTVAAIARPAASQPVAQKPSVQTASAPAVAKPQVAAKPQVTTTAQVVSKPTTAAVPGPAVTSGGSSGGLVAMAMRYLGARYVFGGTSPSGFDCSGFVWYVHNAAGRPVSRGLWGQLNGGARIPVNSLQPGDTVFFANTYMPGLSHAGIYIGGGRFIHASDEYSGVKISSLSEAYWGSRYVSASRLW